MSIFVIAAVVGLLLPIICLPIVWRDRPARLYTLIFLAIQLIQIFTERLMATQGLIHFIKYTATAFVLLRLAQLAYGFKGFQRFLKKTGKLQKTVVSFTYLGNWALWLVVLVRLLLRIIGLR